MVVQVDVPERAIYVDGRGVKADARVGYHGVIVSFESKDGPLTFQCDHYNSSSWRRRDDPAWHANIRAIALGLEHLRTIDRYGIDRSNKRYTGWKQLGSGIPMGPTQMTADEAARFLAEWAGLETCIGLLDNQRNVESAYRTAAKRLHPDRGGDAEVFKRLNEARDLLLR